MILDNLKLLFKLFYRPQTALSDTIDRGNWVFGAAAVLIVAAIFQFTISSKINEAYSIPQFKPPAYNQADLSLDPPSAAAGLEFDRAAYESALANYQKQLQSRPRLPLVGDWGLWLFSFDSSFFTILMSLAFFYVPATILLLTVLAPIGSFGLLVRRDYATLLTCALLAWAASHLPFAVIGAAASAFAGVIPAQSLSPQIYLAMWLASAAHFGVLMIFALRTVFGVSLGSAAATICFSWLSISAGMLVFKYIPPLLFSPFLLFYAYAYFRGELGTIGGAYRQRQNFRRFLNNAALNPHDSDAHVQLGLIYKQRRQPDQALKHFQKAVEIQKDEIDANYELGQLARTRGDLQEAIDRFSIVVEQNEKYALNEIWREIGATYLAAGMLAEAREALEKFVERRPFDPEGLYHLGQTLKAQNEPERAREMFNRCVEAVQTSPDYRRHEQKQWAGLAKKQIV
jgi:tetratricopeptide (TPR) repeat protein